METEKPRRKRVGNRKADSKQSANKLTTNKLELLITIVDRRKGEFYADLIQSFDVNMQMLCFGQGTAKKEMLSLLGLVNSDKTVIFSVIREDKIESALLELEDKFKTIKNGNGIAFTVPMSSIIGVAIFGFLSNNRSTVKESK